MITKSKRYSESGIRDKTETTGVAQANIAPGPRFGNPVYIWSSLGILLTGIGATAVIRWIASPYFTPAPVGNTPVPTTQYVILKIHDFGSIAFAIWFGWHFVLKPLIKTREISWDGMFVIACLCMYWMDPLFSYVNFTITYNHHLFNMGSWAPFIPGWGYPNFQNFAEPIMFLGSLYIWFFFGVPVLGCKFIGVIRRRFPDMNILSILAIMFLIFAAIDATMEIIHMRLCIAAYAGTVHSFTVWADEPNQWPLYEGLVVSIMFVVTTCLRYFRDDKGYFFVEKGIDNVKVRKPLRKVLSFFAISGFLQALYLFSNVVPFNFLAAHVDTFPAYPSYMIGGVCGEGTDYVCPSKKYVPIPYQGGSLYIRPDDPRLPADVREKQSGGPYGFFSGIPEK